jgi:hypothetical protein
VAGVWDTAGVEEEALVEVTEDMVSNEHFLSNKFHYLLNFIKQNYMKAYADTNKST